jgi:predicted Zn-dependent protease
MEREEATAAIRRALDAGRNDGMEVGMEGESIGFTRFSNDRITQNVSRQRSTMTVKANFGRREGRAKTTDFSEGAIRRTVERAEDIARHTEENLEFMPPLPPTDPPLIDSHHMRTVEVGPNERADMVRLTLERSAEAGHPCAGILGNGTLFRAFGNSAGHEAFHRRSWARMNCTVLTDDSSGWQRVTVENIDDIHPEDVFATALSKAEASRDPVDVETGRYTVVLESAAVVDLLAFFFWTYNAKLAHERRSFMTGKVGEQIFHPSVTLSSEPGHPRCPGIPFQMDGLPCRPITWVDKGVARKLIHDRFWADKLKTDPTGMPGNLLMEGTDASVDDLVAGVKNGILVSRFWYVRYVDPMELMLTGMTRDGTFLIEDGKIVTGIKNMRWNDSVPGILSRVDALGTPQRQGEMVDALVPSLRVPDFNFTSKTLF